MGCSKNEYKEHKVDEHNGIHLNLIEICSLIDPQQITEFAAGDPNENPWVEGQPQLESIALSAHDPIWPLWYEQIRAQVVTALANQVLSMTHVGSTAVPDLAAKPVIDIDMIVADPQDEASYVPRLTRLGYRLTIREPSWYQHRMLRLDRPRVNLHVFAPNCPEHIRHLLFRDWLITHTDDRQRYAAVKQRALDGVDTVQAYNLNKQAVIRDIYQNIFKFYNLLGQD